MQEREHPYTGHFYQTWPVDKDNVTVGSVDVLITSPPYNLGTKTGDSGSAILNDQAFFELLKSVFVHGEKLLKDGGILVFDIALWIRKEHGTGDKWEARDACLTWAKKASLQLLSDFKYSLLDLTKSGQTHSGDDGMHSDEQHILVFGKKNQSQLLSLPPCDPDNPLFPFPKSYRSDAEFRPEPFWPLELVRDLVSVFQLDRKNICVLDPFMGSGQIGLHVARHGGVFIGFEVQNNLREELEKIWDFEFSVEEAQAKRDLEKTETKKNFWPSYIKYAGLTLIDHLSKISRLPTGVFIDKKYLKAVKEKAIFEALEHTKTSLAAILIKNGIAEDVQLQSGSDGRILSFPGRIAPENIPENRINNEWNLLEQEKSALDLNFQFLEIEAHRANMWFLPIKIPRGHGSDVFSYLVLVLSGTAQLPLYERNRLMAHIRRLLADVLLRRAEVYAQLSYAEQERSARVAVFARNFSHIIGSHVISNPEFKAALVGDKVLSGIRQQLDRAHGDFIRAENDYLRDGIDMDTEALWREGTKVLEGMRQGLRTGGALLENTRRFHEYLQGRFDFIARAIDETKDQPEPIYFVADLMEGFLSQTAFLDNLVADVGLRLSQMQFVLKLPHGILADNSVEFVACWEYNEKTGALDIGWKQRIRESLVDANIQEHSVMVALPGGMVSCHAFYSLLENIIRNSAKYGVNKVKEHANGYQIDLELKREEGHYTLRISDNFSVDEEHAVTLSDETEKKIRLVDRIRNLIHADFIEVDGKPRREGQGMLEMQACAESLYRQVEGKNTTKRVFPAHQDKNLDVTAKGVGKPIVYSLRLNAPVLLGLVYGSSEATGKLSGRLRTPKAFIERGAHILLLDGEADEKVRKKWFMEIEENHHALPYRLLVLCKKDRGSADEWNKLITRSKLPARRVHVLADSDAYKKIVESSWVTLPPAKEAGMTFEETRVIDAYDAWLRAWKGVPPGEKWHLWVGLERTESQVENSWCKVEKFKSDIIQVGVRAYQKNLNTQGRVWHSGGQGKNPFSDATGRDGRSPVEIERGYWAAELDALHCKKRALLFDNHGNCFKLAGDVERTTDFCDGTRFYQKLTGANTPDLFRAISHPPSNPFAFSFFIHSLVESCLTNVMVVDERLAWNLLSGSENGNQPSLHFSEDLASHQKTGVFPVFTFKQDDRRGKTLGFFSPRHREFVGQLVSLGKDGNPNLNDEGVRFKGCGTTNTNLEVLVPPRMARSEKDNFPKGFRLLPVSAQETGLLVCPLEESCGSITCDVLVIHEGALDLVAKSEGVQWEQVFADQLYALAPAVVRTSGRGRETKQFWKHNPFIEFGEVSASLLTARNKHSLARGLLGSAGPLDKDTAHKEP